MTKKVSLVIIGLIAVAVIGYFFTRKNSGGNSDLVKYVEPTTNFFDASQVTTDQIVVKITDKGFEPAELNIKRGQQVTWINETETFAWPASDPHPTHTNYPEFDPQLPMKKGQAWSFTFNKIGSWGYHNHLNSSNRGVVNVTD